MEAAERLGLPGGADRADTKKHFSDADRQFNALAAEMGNTLHSTSLKLQELGKRACTALYTAYHFWLPVVSAQMVWFSCIVLVCSSAAFPQWHDNAASTTTRPLRFRSSLSRSGRCVGNSAENRETVAFLLAVRRPSSAHSTCPSIYIAYVGARSLILAFARLLYADRPSMP